jgi:hypothetical protein
MIIDISQKINDFYVKYRIDPNCVIMSQDLFKKLNEEYHGVLVKDSNYVGVNRVLGLDLFVCEGENRIKVCFAGDD